MGLDHGLKLGETLMIGVQPLHIGVIEGPQHDVRWRYGTELTERRIDTGIKSNNYIELRQRDLTQGP